MFIFRWRESRMLQQHYLSAKSLAEFKSMQSMDVTEYETNYASHNSTTDQLFKKVFNFLNQVICGRISILRSRYSVFFSLS